MGVSKNRVVLPPKMDGENNGSKPYEQMDDLFVFFRLFLGWHPHTDRWLASERITSDSLGNYASWHLSAFDTAQ